MGERRIKDTSSSKVQALLDLIAKERSRHVSSAAAAAELPEPAPDNASTPSALDTTGSAPLCPASTLIPVKERQLLIAADAALILQVPRSLVYALALRGDLPATPRSWGSQR